MLDRCRNKNGLRYKDYGGRGIKVCEEWLSFSKFEAWCSKTYEEGKTLNRIDNDGDYSPENCNWATASEQQVNSRHSTPKRIERTKKRVLGAIKFLHAKYGNPDNRKLKNCPSCNCFLSVSNFKENKSSRDGFDSMCHTCRKLYDREYARRKRDSQKNKLSNRASEIS